MYFKVYIERGILMNVILEQLKTHTQNKPNDIALHIDDETITYSQLNARITSAVESL